MLEELYRQAAVAAVRTYRIECLAPGEGWSDMVERYGSLRDAVAAVRGGVVAAPTLWRRVRGRIACGERVVWCDANGAVKCDD